MSSSHAYTPTVVDTGVDLDLSRNEGRADAAALLSTVDDPGRLVSRYPDTTGLRDRLAELHGIGTDQVLVTAGGDDALHRCVLALCRDAGAVTTYPTFEMIPVYAGQLGVALTEVPWWSGPLPTDEMLAAVDDRTGAAFLVSPNNPTGAVVTWEELERLAAVMPAVVLDAAYAEFADDDLSPAALGLGNVVVARTLSKAYGLAGLRVGYLLGPPGLVARIGSQGSPYPVAALSAALATARLDMPRQVTDSFVGKVRRERATLLDLAGDLGVEAFPSQANFVLLRVGDAERAADAARAAGIAWRRFPGRPGMEGLVRITLPGDPVAFARLRAVCESVLAETEGSS